MYWLCVTGLRLTQAFEQLYSRIFQYICVSWVNTQIMHCIDQFHIYFFQMLSMKTEGGRTVKDHVYRVLHRIIEPDLQRRFNRLGTYGKLKFPASLEAELKSNFCLSCHNIFNPLLTESISVISTGSIGIGSKLDTCTSFF